MSWNESEKSLKLNHYPLSPLESYRMIFLDMEEGITPEERFQKDLEEIRIFIYGD